MDRVRAVEDRAVLADRDQLRAGPDERLQRHVLRLTVDGEAHAVRSRQDDPEIRKGRSGDHEARSVPCDGVKLVEDLERGTGPGDAVRARDDRAVVADREELPSAPRDVAQVRAGRGRAGRPVPAVGAAHDRSPVADRDEEVSVPCELLERRRDPRTLKIPEVTVQARQDRSPLPDRDELRPAPQDVEELHLGVRDLLRPGGAIRARQDRSGATDRGVEAVAERHRGEEVPLRGRIRPEPFAARLRRERKAGEQKSAGDDGHFRHPSEHGPLRDGIVVWNSAGLYGRAARTTRTAALRRCPRFLRAGPEARTRAE